VLSVLALAQSIGAKHWRKALAQSIGAKHGLKGKQADNYLNVLL
jgi:hypothetical protein